MAALVLQVSGSLSICMQNVHSYLVHQAARTKAQDVRFAAKAAVLDLMTLVQPSPSLP